MRLSSTALASFLLLSTGHDQHNASPHVASAFSPSQTTTKRSSSVTIAFNTPAKKVLTAADVLSNSQNQSRNKEEEGEEIPKLFSEEIYSDFQSALLKLEKRVKEGRGALSLMEVEEFEAETGRIVQEMNAYLNDPEGMKKKISDGYASSSQGSSPSNSILPPASTTHTLNASVPPPPITNSFPPAKSASISFEPPRRPMTDVSDDEGPAFDGKGYGLARGTTNTYIIPGMDQMSPEEYRAKLQETISARQAKRREESLRNRGGAIGNRSSSGYLEQLGRQQQQQQQGKKNELFEVQREDGFETRLESEKMEQRKNTSEPSKNNVLDHHHEHASSTQNLHLTMNEEARTVTNQRLGTSQVKDVESMANLQNIAAVPPSIQSDLDSHQQTQQEQQQQQAMTKSNESFQPEAKSVKTVQESVKLPNGNVLQPTIQSDSDSKQPTLQQHALHIPNKSVRPEEESAINAQSLADHHDRHVVSPMVLSETDSTQETEQCSTKVESMNVVQNLAQTQNRDVLPPTTESQLPTQQLQASPPRSKGSVRPKAESVIDYASLLKQGRAEKELNRKSEWQAKGSTYDKKKDISQDEKLPSFKEEKRWFTENRQRPVPSSVPPAYAKVDEKYVGDASRQSSKSPSSKHLGEGETWYDEKRIRPIPTAEAPQRPKVFDRTGPKLEPTSKGSKKALNTSESQHGKEKVTWYNEKRVRPSPNADVPQRPKVFDRTGAELESPLKGLTTNSSFLRSLLQDDAPNRQSKGSLQMFEKTVSAFTASSEIKQWWKDTSQRPKNYVRHYTPMNYNYEARPVHPKNYGDMKLVLTEWSVVESDAGSDDDVDNVDD